MVGNWEEVTVEELVKRGLLERPIDGNHGSIHPKGSDFISSGVPFIMASDLVGGGIDTVNCSFIAPEQAKMLRKGFSKTGDVLLSHKATLGRTAIVGMIPGDFVMLTPQVTYYRSKDYEKLNNRYLKYYFDSQQFQQILESWGGGGSTRAYLGITAQLRLPILLPPPTEQKRIARILGALDDKIELNRRMNSTLEAVAQMLFQRMFIDRIADGLPKGWSEETVSDIGLLNRASVTPGKFPDEIFSHYSLPAFDEGRLPKQEAGGKIMSNKTLVSSDSVLISKLNPRIPRIWLPATTEPNRAISSTEFLVVSPKSDVSREFLYCLFANDFFMSKLATMVTGTSGSHQRIRPDSLLDMKIVVPSKASILDFTNAVAAMLQKVQSNIEQSRTLANHRDALLPLLLNGGVTRSQET
ncbi:MAG: restriction endonuclease subunit S [Proteobacteria bacterium]|nr:MAG: restriction endonuclease subunit S [Pseudomonadota bacterium]